MSWRWRCPQWQAPCCPHHHHVPGHDTPSLTILCPALPSRTPAQAAPSGKPPAVVDKMVEGRLKKYYEEAVLAEQRFFLDDTLTVAGVVDKWVWGFGHGASTFCCWGCCSGDVGGWLDLLWARRLIVAGRDGGRGL